MNKLILPDYFLMFKYFSFISVSCNILLSNVYLCGYFSRTCSDEYCIKKKPKGLFGGHIQTHYFSYLLPVFMEVEEG